ncbi:subtilisin family serine protease [Kribbella amoyensis]|uniref:Subtilisin family serine protease n=1 Tax=Kribbella amoyensis TaxID=996641 RepID=A0A561BLF7_9ACTN|nr:S8 family serine peptidase [Kribbella amoyensis]TWD79724.1 subtilisin family serine protease [Kribbella amoyensis]
MRTSRRVAGLVPVVAVGALLASLAAVPVTAAAPPPPPNPPTANPAHRTPGAETHRVTLITGDVAEYTSEPGGQHSARLLTGENWFLSRTDGKLTIVPPAAYGLVASGRLDQRLFNLTDLVAQGYDDARTATLPLLLTGDTAPRAPQAATTRRTLAAAGATAVSVQKSEATRFWQGLQGGNLRSTGTEKVWLDGRTHATLDRSTQQIGAPTAWRSGYDGRGVKVAVLDTGYDRNHPDLKDQVIAAKSFVPDPDVQDKHGHGTHTASTVAGLGAASQGKRKGVAPGADLLIGKVLNDNGAGLDSEAIAGMEWAVEQGAKVVSMSLGTDLPSDASDPMSQTVERLSERTGALFVVAAGNTGLEEFIGSPAAASHALTVGAVDRNDKLAAFSSRGPRYGDGAMKPEVTAPGVDIAAARAAGTNTGRNLSEYYTTMSGTSMAAPHVSGAAAILAQRHPDWTGRQLKAALVGSALSTPGTSPLAQGLGRVDVAKALAAKVVADDATVLFGDLSWTGTAPPPVTRTLTYRNPGTKPLTLDLTADVRTPAGVRPKLKVTPAGLRIAPGGSATATVTLDQAATPPGKYSGAITARSAGSTYRTGVGFTAGGKLHRITVDAVGRDGRPAPSTTGIPSGAHLWNLDTGRAELTTFDRDGRHVFEVPTGRYSLMVFVIGLGPDGTIATETLLGQPELTVNSDRALSFDARQAHRIDIRTPRRADLATVGLAWSRHNGDRFATAGWRLGTSVTDVYVQNFGKPRTGKFQILQRWDLVEPMVTVDVNGSGGFRLRTPEPAAYHLPYVGSGALGFHDGGTGEPGELDGADGKVALLRWKGIFETVNQVRAARDAGARLVLLYNETPELWSADATEVGLPAYMISRQDAHRLLGLKPATLQVTGLRNSTYRYDLAMAPEVVRNGLTYDLAKLRPAELTTTFHRNASWPTHVESRKAYLDGIPFSLESIRTVNEDHVRTDYVYADSAGIQWSEEAMGGAEGLSGRELTVPRAYRAGERVGKDWWVAITRPAVPAIAGGEADGLPAARFEDALRVAVPQHVNGNRSVYGWSDNKLDRSTLVLRSNGRELGRRDWSTAAFPVPKQTAWYDLSLDVRRAPNTWATTSIATHTEWRFRSGTTKTRAVLPLVQVDYSLETGRDNAVPAKGGSRLVLTPGYQPGASGPGFFRTTAEISYDGSSWHRLFLLPVDLRGSVGARLPAVPAGTGAVHLRVTATDLAGNRVGQQIEKAWLVEQN